MTLSIEERIRRYQAWRLREPVDRPMVGLLWEPDIPPLPEFLDRVGVGNEVQPGQIEPTLFLPYVDDWYEQDARLTGDVIQPFTPAFGIPWVEAIAGCPVVAHPGSLWAEPTIDSYDKRPPIAFDAHNPWLKALVAFTEAMVEHAAGRFAVALPQMRGPLDTLAAMRTPERMSLDFIEQPEEVRRILAELTELWIAIARAVLAVIPPFHGGYCTRMKMWAPGPAVNPQNDISTLISSAMYREFVLPFDRQIMAAFPYSSYHVHATEHHQLENWLELEALTAIQFTLEHTVGGPPMEVTLPKMERVLERKPLLLVALDTESADLCLEQLPGAGLCVMVGFNAPVVPEGLATWVEERAVGQRQRTP